MYIDLEKIKEHPELLEIIKESHGNIFPNILDEMIEVFGEDFEVILKCYSNPRHIITLQELQILEETDTDLFDDIREVFIHSDDYDYIFQSFENEVI